MFALFAGLKSLWSVKAIITDGPVFRLHCKWTVLFLLCCSLLLSCRQYFGDPIHCLQKDATRIEALETFCWIHATFIMPHAWNATIGDEVPHPGIINNARGKPRVYQAYYQWVAFVLLLQGVLFYTPKYLWKCYEKGTLKALVLDLRDPLLPSQQAEKSINLLANALKQHWGHFSTYVRSYLMCEFLSLVNIIGQMFLMNTFLGGAFTSFGLEVVMWSEWNQQYRTDPLVKTFPRMTKCIFFEYGPGGSVNKLDALCILPLNILNEKIVIFLWFWFLFLCVITIAMLLFRVLLSCLPFFRYCILLPWAMRANKGALDKLLMNASMGDWFIIYLLAKNIDPSHFASLVGQLSAAMMQNGHLLTHRRSSIGKELDFV